MKRNETQKNSEIVDFYAHVLQKIDKKNSTTFISSTVFRQNGTLYETNRKNQQEIIIIYIFLIL